MPMFNNLITRGLKKSYFGLNVYAFVWAFVCYFSMYAFRKPFTVETFEGLKLWDVDFKIMCITFQVIGYTISKFYGIKFISELNPNYRGLWIILFILIAEVALIIFGAVPRPYNALLMFVNGLPLGMIWGLVFSYLEGRKTSEVLGSGMAVSFIVSSGAVKSVGQALINAGCNGFWMPAAVGAIFFIPLVLSVFFLESLPPPNEKDIESRTIRVPMTGHDRWVFFKKFAPGIVLMTLFYMCLSAFRDFRDNFAKELWAAFGYEKSPSIFATSEIIVAVVVVIPIALFMLIKENIHTFFAYYILIICGMILTLACTIIFHQNKMDGLYFMIITGVGLYLCYIPFNSIIFDLMIATFKETANSGFLMYICDSFGYLSSIVILFIKQFGTPNLNWLSFYIYISYGMAILGIILNIFSGIYYFFRYRRHDFGEKLKADYSNNEIDISNNEEEDIKEEDDGLHIDQDVEDDSSEHSDHLIEAL